MTNLVSDFYKFQHFQILGRALGKLCNICTQFYKNKLSLTFENIPLMFYANPLIIKEDVKDQGISKKCNQKFLVPKFMKLSENKHVKCGYKFSRRILHTINHLIL